MDEEMADEPCRSTRPIVRREPHLQRPRGRAELIPCARRRWQIGSSSTPRGWGIRYPPQSGCSRWATAPREGNGMCRSRAHRACLFISVTIWLLAGRLWVRQSIRLFGLARGASLSQSRVDGGAAASSERRSHCAPQHCCSVPVHNLCSSGYRGGPGLRRTTSASWLAKPPGAEKYRSDRRGHVAEEHPISLLVGRSAAVSRPKRSSSASPECRPRPLCLLSKYMAAFMFPRSNLLSSSADSARSASLVPAPSIGSLRQRFANQQHWQTTAGGQGTASSSLAGAG